LAKLDLITRITVENLARNHLHNCESSDLDFDVVRTQGSKWTIEPTRTKNVHVSFPPFVRSNSDSTQVQFSSLLARCEFAKKHNRIDLYYDCELLETSDALLQFNGNAGKNITKKL